MFKLILLMAVMLISFDCAKPTSADSESKKHSYCDCLLIQVDTIKNDNIEHSIPEGYEWTGVLFIRHPELDVWSIYKNGYHSIGQGNTFISTSDMIGRLYKLHFIRKD